VPSLLVMNDGRKITTPALWEQHRKELFEIFDREFFGRLPEAAKNIKVTWEVTATTQGMSGNIPTITRTLVGHVDPTYYPAIKVDIAASVTTPANAAGKVPVIIQWGGGGGGGRAGGGAAPAGNAARGAAPAPAPGGARGGGPAPAGRKQPPFPNGATTWQQAAISLGWGYGNLNPGSIQADSGNNNQLRQGIIGLINKGESRKGRRLGRAPRVGLGCGQADGFLREGLAR
jgi:hypothetical protein